MLQNQFLLNVLLQMDRKQVQEVPEQTKLDKRAEAAAKARERYHSQLPEARAKAAARANARARDAYDKKTHEE